MIREPGTRVFQQGGIKHALSRPACGLAFIATGLGTWTNWTTVTYILGSRHGTRKRTKKSESLAVVSSTTGLYSVLSDCLFTVLIFIVVTACLLRVDILPPGYF